MTRFDYRTRVLAAALCALAGFVDALAFLKLGGFFVSFMSGNSTRLGVGLAQWSSNAGVAGGLVVTFVVGVLIGSLVGGAAGVHRRWAVLLLVSVLLAAAAALNAGGYERFAVAMMALAMGSENAVFEEDGEVRIGLTYMTGTLVKVGQRLAAAVTGGDRLAWAPHLLLWVGLVIGASVGGAIYPYLGLEALWLASGAALALAIVARVGGDRRRTNPLGRDFHG